MVLFARTTRSTRLTSAGKLFSDHVPHVFAALQQARDSVKAAANGDIVLYLNGGKQCQSESSQGQSAQSLSITDLALPVAGTRMSMQAPFGQPLYLPLSGQSCRSTFAASSNCCRIHCMAGSATLRAGHANATSNAATSTGGSNKRSAWLSA